MKRTIGSFFERVGRAIFQPSEHGKTRRGVVVIVLVALLLGIYVAPGIWNKAANGLNSQTTKVAWLHWLKLPNKSESGFHLGLDLQGGAHLVYEADVKNIASGDQREAVEGVRDVIERRVNAFGVTEPVVQTSNSAGVWKVIVELAGIKDIHQAIKMIGETPVLEFKEEGTVTTRPLTAIEQKEKTDYNVKALQRAKDIIKEMLAQKEIDFPGLAKKYSEDVATKDVGGSLGFISRFSPYSVIWDWADKNGKGKISLEPVETPEGYEIISVSDVRTTGKEVKAEHILICYKGAQGCDKETSKDDARKQIEDIAKQATPKNFAELITKYSTDPTVATSKGDLGWFGMGMMVKPFEDVVFPQKVDTISGVVETPFGFHLIHKTGERDQKEYQVSRILIKKKTDSDFLPPAEPWKATGLSGKQLKRAVLEFDQRTGEPAVTLEFNDEGKQMFADITRRNVGKTVAIMLDGQPISVPRVNEAITEGKARISGNFTVAEGKLLVQRLNAGALPVPINLISQQTIGASLGEKAVNDSFKAGMIGFALVALFMILYYRLSGVLAVLALALYVLINLAIFKWVPVTLTLAGIAGFILSLGIAVDANVLIFERMKEELRGGKDIEAAIVDGYKRSWPSIRDGNVTTLFGALILFWFATSSVKGFGLTLTVGILISLFTAMVVSRTFLRLAGRVVKNRWWYGA